MVISALSPDIDLLPPAPASAASAPEGSGSFGDREAHAWLERGRARIDAARKDLEAAGAQHVGVLVRGGIPERVIVDFVGRHEPELVAMASHGRSGLARTLLGSVPDYVLHHLEGIPILLVRPSGAE
jgi:nucleotide-binding universal stress UspA family protein